MKLAILQMPKKEIKERTLSESQKINDINNQESIKYKRSEEENKTENTDKNLNENIFFKKEKVLKLKII